MAKLYIIFLAAMLVLAHATARNIPNSDEAKPATTTSTNALAPVETVHVTTNNAKAPAAKGVDDEKNFITYGGVGGWAGVGGYTGVIPVLGGVGGVGAGGGVGGVGGIAGLGMPVGGLGGIGVPGVAVGGLGGIGGPGVACGLGGIGVPGVAGGAKRGGIVP